MLRMIHRNLANPAFLAILLVLSTGCTIFESTMTPEQQDVTIEITQTASGMGDSSSILTAETTDVIKDIPTSTLAEQTAAELLIAEHHPMDRYRLAKEISRLTEVQLTPEISDADSLKVNDRRNFIVSKNAKYYNEPFRLRHISDSAYWWTNLDSRADEKDVIAAAMRFEDEVLPINQLIFGNEWSPGIDHDRRFHILLRDDKDWGPYGYFSLINEYPIAIQSNSNQKELFVLKLNEVVLDSPTFAGRLAHEYLHLIHWNLEYNEDHWLNEGLAELAYYLAGAPPSTNTFRNKDRYFAQLPHIQLTSWPEQRFGDDDHTGLAQYSAGKHFFVYLFEQFGAQFIKDIIRNPQPGVASIQEEMDRLPDQPQFNEVYANWLIAKLIDRPQMSQGQFGYQEYPLNYFPYMKKVQSFEGDPDQDKLAPYGARHYLIESQEPVQVSFSGISQARLTPADPPTGNYVWYSNRGDESEFSLTRSFDLTGIDSATINYKIWYELDEYYDYAYLEVSTDGGQTWDILTTAYGTDSNPYDQALGFGYTGAVTEWLPESIDLDPYIGREILVRIQVLTDYNTNRDGVQLDDISIPELGFFDGAEDDSGGWEAQGFIRSSNLVPAEWIVWLVKASNPMQVERITLSPEQMAEFEITGIGEQFNVAAVVISPTAPTTTMELDYELVFQHP